MQHHTLSNPNNLFEITQPLLYNIQYYIAVESVPKQETFWITNCLLKGNISPT